MKKLNIKFKETVENLKVKAAENAMLKESRKAIDRDKKDYFKYLDQMEKHNIQGGMSFADARQITNDRQKTYLETSVRFYDI